MLYLSNWLNLVRVAIFVLISGASTAARTQEIQVRCDVFQRDILGNWTATEQVSMEIPVGTVNIIPGHSVSVPVANVLNTRCG
jgi:hypothetical protein